MKIGNFSLILYFILFFFDLSYCQSFKLKYNNRKTKIDSIIVYNVSNKERCFRVSELNEISKNDTNYYVFAIYFNRKKICIKERLSDNNCDTINLIVNGKYRCKTKKHFSVVSYSYCKGLGIGTSDFSLYAPCCKN